MRIPRVVSRSRRKEERKEVTFEIAVSLHGALQRGEKPAWNWFFDFSQVWQEEWSGFSFE